MDASTMNFSWVIENQLAGCRGPKSSQDLEFLCKNGIKAIIRMATPSESRVTSAEVKSLGLTEYKEPVQDYTPPSQEQLVRITEFISSKLADGKPVAVSCGAGMGRTGTALACYLVANGSSADEAIQEIRLSRPGSIETLDQEDAVRHYESVLKRKKQDERHSVERTK
jgi:atypical dual specificity phosphatase